VCPLQQRHGFDDRRHVGARLLRHVLCERDARLLEHELASLHGVVFKQLLQKVVAQLR